MIQEIGKQKRHPFSFTLGEGPFEYVGSYDMGAALAHQEAYGDTERAFKDAPKLEAGLGTCAHCGRGILNICIVRRGDGKLYGIGSDCILKVAEDGDVSEVSKLEQQIREDRKRKRQAREAAKISELTPQYEEIIPALEERPHPNDYFAGQGKSLADYYEYLLGGSGNAGKIKHMKAAIRKVGAE